MRALLLALGLALLGPRAEDPEEQYRFVVGLAEKGLHEPLVRAARDFLAEQASGERALEVRYRLGAALVELGRDSEAAEALEPLRKERGFRLWREALYRLGRLALVLGKPDRARETFETLLGADPGYLELPATLGLADALLGLADAARAEPRYRAVLERGDAPSRADASWGLAWCAFRLGRADEALAHAARFCAERPDDPRSAELLVLAGEVELARGRFGAALEAYRAAQEGTEDAAAPRGEGFALAGLERHAEAAAAFEHALAKEPEGRHAAECALQAGVARLKAGDAEAARERLGTRSLDADPEALFWRARAELELGRAQPALAALERALELRPSAELAARSEALRGDALSALGREPEAVRAWRAAGSERGLYNAAAASLSAGRHREAAELADELLAGAAAGAPRGEAAFVLGEARFALADYRRAEEAFALVLAAGPGDDAAQQAHARLRIGWCRWLAGDAAGAAEAFERAAGDPPPGGAEALFMLASAEEAAGDAAAACATFARYAERFARGAHAAEALLALGRLESGPAGAARLERLLAEHGASPHASAARLALAERLAAAGERTRAAELYEAVLAGGERELAGPARYGLAWCRFEEQDYGAAGRLARELGAERGAPAELRAAACELALWCAAAAGDAAGVAQAWPAFAETTRDEARRLAGAQRAVPVLAAAGRADEARALLAELARGRDPEAAAGALVEQAFLELDLARVDQAEAALERALELAPQAPRALEAAFFAGEARYAAGELPRAAALYDRASQAGEAALAERALYKGGFARLEAGDPAGAERCFRELERRYPASVLRLEASYLIGEAQFRAARYAEAAQTLEALRPAARGHEVRPKVLFRLGQALGELGRHQASAEVLAALAKEHADFANLGEAELWRGRALAALGDAHGARRALARTLELERGALAAQARLALGRIARAEGDLEGALAEFLKVAVLYEGDAAGEALLAAGEVLEQRGEPELAAERYRELVSAHAGSPPARAAAAHLARLERAGR